MLVRANNVYSCCELLFNKGTNPVIDGMCGMADHYWRMYHLFMSLTTLTKPMAQPLDTPTLILASACWAIRRSPVKEEGNPRGEKPHANIWTASTSVATPPRATYHKRRLCIRHCALPTKGGARLALALNGSKPANANTEKTAGPRSDW